MPDFFVIGAYKCGTTTVHDMLRQHPQLYVPAYKEPNFFAFSDDLDPSTRPLMGVDRREDYDELFRGALATATIGEVSPAYLPVPGTARRIHDAVPHAKLIVVLRDPVERAFSDYLMYLRDGREPYAEFTRALAEQPQRAESGLETGRYISTGFYGQQLTAYFELFPSSQILVLFADDPVHSLGDQMPRVWEFLDVAPMALADPTARLNGSGVPGDAMTAALFGLHRRNARSKRPFLPSPFRSWVDRTVQSRVVRPAVPSSDAARLYELYREDIALLESLLSLSLDRWRHV